MSHLDDTCAFLIGRNMREAQLRRELQIAFDEEERGEAEPWEVESVLQEAPEKLKRRCSTN